MSDMVERDGLHLGEGGWSDAVYEVLRNGFPTGFRVDYGCCDGSAHVMRGRETVDYCEDGTWENIEAVIASAMKAELGAKVR